MPRRILQGIVVSDKMDKTITVKVERQVMHPLYKKFVKKTKKFKAHDEDNQAKIGEIVNIRECRPLSKHKSFELMQGDELAKSGGKKSAPKKPAPPLLPRPEAEQAQPKKAS